MEYQAPPAVTVNVFKTCTSWVAGAGADLGSTEYALARNAVAVERNPLQQTSGARVAWAAAYAGGGCAADALLQKSGRPRLAKVIRIAAFAIKLGLAANNIRHAR
jgi:hypothetical protein